jgi:hypothetical protein
MLLPHQLSYILRIYVTKQNLSALYEMRCDIQQRVDMSQYYCSQKMKGYFNNMVFVSVL